MGAQPKRKTSKARKNIRRSHIKVASLNSLVACSQCNAMKLSHQTCPTCGTYNGREVIAMKAPEKKSE